MFAASTSSQSRIHDLSALDAALGGIPSVGGLSGIGSTRDLPHVLSVAV